MLQEFSHWWPVALLGIALIWHLAGVEKYLLELFSPELIERQATLLWNALFKEHAQDPKVVELRQFWICRRALLPW